MSEHAIREYLKTIGNGGGGVQQETDPVFTASPAYGISAQDIADWNDKQEELVSGTNIKTINGTTLLGSGDITVAAGGTSVPTADEVAEFDSDAHMNSTDMTTQDVSDFVDGLNVHGVGVKICVTDVQLTGNGSYFITASISTLTNGQVTDRSKVCSVSAFSYKANSSNHVYACTGARISTANTSNVALFFGETTVPNNEIVYLRVVVEYM